MKNGWKLWGTDKPAGFRDIGYLPQIILAEDPGTAREQIDARYAHGGGFSAFEGFELLEGERIQYPGDPAYQPLAYIDLPSTNERVITYNHAWVRIVQADGSWQVCRMD